MDEKEVIKIVAAYTKEVSNLLAISNKQVNCSGLTKK
jgi:hypothetical protein